MLKKLNKPPYKIDKRSYRRFDQRKTIFGRILLDKKAEFYRRGMYDQIERIVKGKKRGDTRIDYARMLGAWTVYDYFHGAFSTRKLSQANNIMKKPILKRYRADPEKMTLEIKRTARYYGAALVGICQIDHRWVYTHNLLGKRIRFPKDIKFAIVMAIAMDPKRIKTSPQFGAAIETALGYSKMAFCIACLAEFIRYLGYRAIPAGNDLGLSIPLAIDAGLGELGRNGLLITPRYGPCIRLCKVFTNLPLIPDKPIKFGVTDYCRKCRRCAESCEVGAIQKGPEPSFKPVCISNNPGVLKWAVDHERCYQYWTEIGADCSTCISVCPYTPSKSR